MQLDRLNNLMDAAAADELKRCCGSAGWVQAMLLRRPFADAASLLKAADDEWWQLGEIEWREAFAQHPQIGGLGTTAGLPPAKLQAADWCRSEQSGVNKASEAVLQELASLNYRYREKFGYIFIVCASGKTAEEMLFSLQQRIKNDPQTEIRIAAAEQNKITAIRLEKLCTEARSQPTC